MSLVIAPAGALANWEASKQIRIQNSCNEGIDRFSDECLIFPYFQPRIIPPFLQELSAPYDSYGMQWGNVSGFCGVHVCHDVGNTDSEHDRATAWINLVSKQGLDLQMG